MPARINYIQSGEEARFRVEDDQASALGPISPAVERTITELAARWAQGTTVHVARDREDTCIAFVEDEQGADPVGEAFALAEDGRIGWGGTNQPRYYPTVEALLAAGSGA